MQNPINIELAHKLSTVISYLKAYCMLWCNLMALKYISVKLINDNRIYSFNETCNAAFGHHIVFK